MYCGSERICPMINTVITVVRVAFRLLQLGLQCFTVRRHSLHAVKVKNVNLYSTVRYSWVRAADANTNRNVTC